VRNSFSTPPPPAAKGNDDEEEEALGSLAVIAVDEGPAAVLGWSPSRRPTLILGSMKPLETERKLGSRAACSMKSERETSLDTLRHWSLRVLMVRNSSTLCCSTYR